MRLLLNGLPKGLEMFLNIYVVTVGILGIAMIASGIWDCLPKKH